MSISLPNPSRQELSSFIVVYEFSTRKSSPNIRQKCISKFRFLLFSQFLGFIAVVYALFLKEIRLKLDVPRSGLTNSCSKPLRLILSSFGSSSLKGSWLRSRVWVVYKSSVRCTSFDSAALSPIVSIQDALERGLRMYMLRKQNCFLSVCKDKIGKRKSVSAPAVNHFINQSGPIRLRVCHVISTLPGLSLVGAVLGSGLKVAPFRQLVGQAALRDSVVTRRKRQPQAAAGEAGSGCSRCGSIGRGYSRMFWAAAMHLGGPKV